MLLRKTSKRSDILSYLKDYPRYKVIIVEGYDGVGKGYLLQYLCNKLCCHAPYRPDYKFWQGNYNLPPTDRWKINAYFLNILSCLDINLSERVLFDRGMLSGAVYNHDKSIAENFKEITQNNPNILHILVECSAKSYKKFFYSRSHRLPTKEELQKFKSYSIAYRETLDISGTDYIIYNNYYKDHTDTCSNCGHYSYGFCMHPQRYKEPVLHLSSRCKLTYDKEVQDGEM